MVDNIKLLKLLHMIAPVLTYLHKFSHSSTSYRYYNDSKKCFCVSYHKYTVAVIFYQQFLATVTLA